MSRTLKTEGKKKRRAVAVLLLILALGMIVYGAVQLIGMFQVYQEGSANYEDLSNRVRRIVPTDPQTPQPGTDTGSAQQPQVDIPGVEVDFRALKAISGDAVAWLYCPDTPIDYPVMKANDYSYYLSHLPDGTLNANGALFIDYNCASDFSDPLTVIYGHHMQSGMMFGSINGYKNQRYFEEHPFMYLYTEQGNYRVELIYGCVIGEGQWRERAFMYAVNKDALLSYAAQSSTFKSPVSYREGDRIVVLSTCSYEFDDARYVVIGILRPEYQEAEETPKSGGLSSQE
jgi:sortase B